MVPAFEITHRKAGELRVDILPSKTRKAFIACSSFDFLSCSNWYLAGGTALALQVGHRTSIDLDFFTPKGEFKEQEIERQLLNTGHWTTSLQEKGTLYGELMGAKMSFIAYPFFKPTPSRLQYENICILTSYDIAAMKIVAISQRGRKRDFVDLYWHAMHRELLKETIRKAMQQYPGQEHNLPHILKSLVYFTDADQDPMPTLLFRADWRTIKTYFRREIPKITKELLLKK
jgi:hypothetical protein